MFEDIDFEFKPGFNLILGDNGVGKTTILEAITVAVSGFLAGMEDVNTRNIYKDDVHYQIVKDNNGIPNKIYKGHVNAKNKTGYDAARAILDANNLNDIDVIETKGTLTDHYDPNRKVIRLSSRVFHDPSVASVAVAAHECGHAIQDKEGYNFLRIRSFLVPFVNFSTRLGYIVVFIGLLFSSYNVAMIGIALLMAMLM